MCARSATPTCLKKRGEGDRRQFANHVDKHSLTERGRRKEETQTGKLGQFFSVNLHATDFYPGPQQTLTITFIYYTLKLIPRVAFDSRVPFSKLTPQEAVERYGILKRQYKSVVQKLATLKKKAVNGRVI